ncbi:acylphosphatase [Patescibacteria group bacterium]|nr:acylphosphatase [Patescibacteria group bacterium]
MPTVKAIISGRVQGVGFRYWLRGKFKQLGVEGEAWNNGDGTVGVEITSGRVLEVKKLVKLLKQGPPLARVDKVTILKE